jgi:hypothetical protein
MSPSRETVSRPARAYTWIACALFGVTLSSGCSSSARTDDPYESCASGDICDDGLDCEATQLPASTGFSGSFCTSGCNTDSDCVQDVTNYAAICVTNGDISQCYLTCPSDDTCPYSQSCLTFDSTAGALSLCTP